METSLRVRGREAFALREYEQAVLCFESYCATEQPDAMDLWYLAESLRKLGRLDASIDVCHLFNKHFPHHVRMRRTYAWALYQRYIKPGPAGEQRNAYFRAAQWIVDHSTQDAFSPYVATVLDVLGTLKGSAHVEERKPWLACIEERLLSEKQDEIERDGKPITLASEAERFAYILVCHLYDARLYAACIQVADDALARFKPLHPTFDPWLARKRALALDALGAHEDAQALLGALFELRNTWTLAADRARILYRLGRSEEAQLMAWQAVVCPGGIEMRISHLLWLAEILAPARDHAAPVLAELVWRIRLDKKYGLHPVMQARLEACGASAQRIRPMRTLAAQIKRMGDERVDTLTVWDEGHVSRILPGGEAFIEYARGQTAFLPRRLARKIPIREGTSLRITHRASVHPKTGRESREVTRVQLLEREGSSTHTGRESSAQRSK